MKDTVKEYLDRKKGRASRQKKAVATLLSLSLVVAAGVTWSLHQTGESLTGQTFCGKTEHTHTEACLKKDTADTKTDKVLTCTLPEHTHTDACIQKTLICGMEEGQGAHTHTADCYQEQQVLTCTQAEHVHGDGCYDADGNLICTTPEHTHGDGCYTTEQVLVCGQEESSGHVHTDACYEITYTCGMQEHTHTDACYTAAAENTSSASAETAAGTTADGTAETKTPEYACGLEEHKHTLQCYSNPNADLETAAAWEQTFAGVTLTGNYGKDVVAIAKTQLGYHESTANYNVVKADDGTEKMKGYTRYGAWYGSPYEDWCAMFASFCIHYAQVDYSLDAGCPGWITTLSKQGRYVSRDVWSPAIGDLVFFDWNNDGTSDHVGIVEALTKDGSVLADDADPTTADGIKTIEGNSSDQVAERSYSRSDSTIMGYGVLPVKTVEYAEGTQTAQCEGYTVKATYGKDAKIPKGAELFVEKSENITAEELAQAIAQSGSDDITDKTVTPLFKLKIGFKQNGKEIEPEKSSAVKVEVTVAGGLTVNEGSGLGVLHYKNDSTTEVIGNVTLGTGEDQSSTAGFETTSFSEYVFYSIEGASGAETEAVTDETASEETTEATVEETSGEDAAARYADQVQELLAADDTAFVSLWKEYESAEDALAFEDYISSLEETSPDTYNTIVARVDALINGEISQPEDTTGTNVTVTLAIKEEDSSYTSDPGSGSTHLSATEAFATTVNATDGVTCTVKDGASGTYTYAMNGTGTICTYTIPAGSSLSAAGVSDSIKLQVSNGTGDTDSYKSAYSWVKENGSVVNIAETTFEEDTTLYLQLYEDSEYYSLDFVCGEENHSISYYMHWTAQLKLGQTVDQWYLDSATETAAAYTYQYCTYGADKGYTFKGWQLKNTETGDMVDLTSSTPITGDYYNNQYGSSIKVYAVWETETGETDALFATDLTTVGTATVNFYVFENGERKLVETKAVTAYKYEDTSDDKRRCISAQDLAEVYGKYGVTKEGIVAGTYVFGHSGVDGSVVWYNRASLKDGNGNVFIPVLDSGSGDSMNVYYIPAQTSSGNTSYSDSTFSTNNSFYTVTVTDPENKVYSAGEIPGVTYGLRGSNVTVTVTTKDDVTWYCKGADNTSVNGTDNGNGTMTFTFNSISQSYTISTEEIAQVDSGTSTVHFYINTVALPYGSEALTDVKVAGKTTWTPKNETVMSTTINADSVSVNKDGTATSASYNIGVKLTGDNQNYIYGGGTLNDNGKISDFSKMTKPTLYDADANIRKLTFTVPNEDGSGSYTYVLANVPDDSTVLEWLAGIMDANGGFENGGTKYITINGHTVKPDELNTDNFEVKWYVVKDSPSDGWHVDGYLITKTSYMTVTKTFKGNQTAIKEIEDKFNVTVQASNTDNPELTYIAHNNFTLKTTSSMTETDAAAKASGDLGCTSKTEDAESGTVTYTWYVPIDYAYNYTVKENNYGESGVTVSNLTYDATARYGVSGSNDSTDNTNGLQSYTSTSTPTVQGKSVTSTQKEKSASVEFENTYTPDGTIILQKLDATSGKGLANVKFTITDSDGNPFKVVQNESGYYVQDTAETGSNTLKTDANGLIYLKDIPAGTYTLTETTLTGYKSIGTITITVEKDGDNSDKNIISSVIYNSENAEVTENPTQWNANGVWLTVTNQSKTAKLQAKKVWKLNEGESRKDVTFRFLRDGVKIADDKKITTYDDDNTKTVDVLTEVPLYVDGKLADYDVLETDIGTTHYDSRYTDGYRYYTVTTKTTYLDADGNEGENKEDAKTVLVTVTNETTTAEVTFKKVDGEGKVVPGAVFYLYKLEGSEKPESNVPTVGFDVIVDGSDSTQDPTKQVLNDYTKTMEATSGTDGSVTFGGSLSDGYYYLIEHSAPRGYELSDTLYLIHNYGGDFTIEKWVWNDDGQSGSWEAVTNNQIVDPVKTLTANLTITKKAAGSNGVALNGAKFTLQNKDGSYYSLNDSGEVTWVETPYYLESGGTKTETGTDADGNATSTDVALGKIEIKDLPAGNYTLTETQAPDGYHKLSSSLTFEVNNDGEIINAKIGDTPVDVTQSSTNDGWNCSFSVDNSTGEELPETGGTGTTLFTLSGLALMGAAFVYGCGLRRRRERRSR